ncbi:MAG: hypothetical protein ACYC7E_12275 [Armatimonadota bacterium]
MKLWLAALLILALPLAIPLAAADIDITPTPPGGATPTTRSSEAMYSVKISSEMPGNLFLANQPITLTARIANSGKEQSAMVTMRVSTGFGCVVQEDKARRTLPEKGVFDVVMNLKDAQRFPNGSYRVETEVVGDGNFGYGTTMLGIWRGPVTAFADEFGISYAGSLDDARVAKDLDLFRQAGVGWLRFPMKGWLPTGKANSPEAEHYKGFLQVAGDRGFNLLAAFTPLVRDDPGVNPVQADKDYRESLLAAVTHYGFKIKNWELLRVKPDPNFTELRGIGFKQMVPAREALRKIKTTKSAQVIYSIEDPFPMNSLELFLQTMPAKGDAVGMRYNFIGIPENNVTPASPIFAVEEVVKNAARRTKKLPPLWVTEYGFEPARGNRLPHALYQAALISSTLIINRARGFARTFWRNDPAATFDHPFIAADGNAMPSLLALRTTLDALKGVTAMTPVPVPLDLRSSPTESKIWSYLLMYGNPKKPKSTKGARYALVIWSESDIRAMTLKTPAAQIIVRDLWGNEIELRPTSNTALFQVDAMPRFLDLGTSNDVELLNAFAKFNPPLLTLRNGGANSFEFSLYNDQRCFSGDLPIEMQFRRWPDPTDAIVRKKTLNPADHMNISNTLTIPENASRGQLYEVSVSLLVGTRRIGYLTLPVWYDPGLTTPDLTLPLLMP